MMSNVSVWIYMHTIIRAVQKRTRIINCNHGSTMCQHLSESRFSDFNLSHLFQDSKNSKRVKRHSMATEFLTQIRSTVIPRFNYYEFHSLRAATRETRN